MSSKIVLSVKPNSPILNYTRVQVIYPNSDYTIVEYYLAYDFNSLTADFGGYLGLLLGYSFLSGYDVAVDIFVRAFKAAK